MTVDRPQYRVRKNIEVTLKDGQRILITADDAEWLREVLNAEYPKTERVSVSNYTLLQPKEHIFFSTKTAGPPKRKSVPLGFVEIGRRNSRAESRSLAPRVYVYYRNAAGELGFQIENHTVYRFRNVGAVKDADSLIGRILRQLPTDRIITKSYLIKNRFTGDNKLAKALFDLLEIEGYLSRALPDDTRRQDEYRRTKKSPMPEVENDRKPEKALVTSGHRAALQ